MILKISLITYILNYYLLRIKLKFSENDFLTLKSIIKARRDVRGNKFLNKNIEKEKIKKILDLAISAPSVGFSQPWEFILINKKKIKNKIYKNFKIEHNNSKKLFKNRKNNIYKDLKLEGIKEAPINLAVFYKNSKKPILGQTSMDKMGEYSVICAIQNLWLGARALNLGVGWVSIIDENKIKTTLNAPKEFKLIAYLCIGYVDEFLDKPELETLKWKKKKELKECLNFNLYDKKIKKMKGKNEKNRNSYNKST